jgi:hypothetical protein
MTKTILTLFTATFFFSQIMPAQGVDTRAKPTDWEEINFEFNQSQIVDGFPAMLRLADLLKQHQDYKVTLTGYADQIGSNRYNDALSLKRANAVAAFLEHYGAAAGQIQTRGDGKRNLEENNRGANARFMNRRVVITVTAPDGTTIGDGTIGSAINEFEVYTRAQMGKIDSILSQLHDLENQLMALRGDTGAIHTDTTAIRQDTGAIHTDTQELVRRPAPLTAEQTTEIARTEATRAADYALTQEAFRNRKYALIGYDEGPTFANGSVHGTGKTGIFSADVFGDALIPFGNGRLPDQPGTHGLQVDGDWVYNRQNGFRQGGLSDGLFDIGLVNRFNTIQLGAFAQFDYVSDYSVRGIDAQGGGMLGNGVLTIDFLIPGGVIGIFGEKGFKEYANIGTTATGSGGLTPYYLRNEDQAGFHASSGFRNFQLDSSIAFKKRYLPGYTNYPAASVKLSYLVTDELGFFAEVDENPTFQNLRVGDRVVFGIQFGNWLHARDVKSTQGVVPVSVPRPHYELLSR